MAHYAIEKGVPLPKPRGAEIYPYRNMKVGDSFTALAENINAVKCAANYYKNRLGRRYTTRRYRNDDKVWRVRVWRIK
jgi:hypothetical protein